MSARHLASVLGIKAPSRALTAGEIEALRREYWRREAGICLRLDEIGDDWLREGMADLMRRKFGLRTAKG